MENTDQTTHETERMENEGPVQPPPNAPDQQDAPSEQTTAPVEESAK